VRSRCTAKFNRAVDKLDLIGVLCLVNSCLESVMRAREPCEKRQGVRTLEPAGTKGPGKLQQTAVVSDRSAPARTGVAYSSTGHANALDPVPQAQKRKRESDQFSSSSLRARGRLDSPISILRLDLIIPELLPGALSCVVGARAMLHTKNCQYSFMSVHLSVAGECRRLLPL
jgi:hypothetical protein